MANTSNVKIGEDGKSVTIRKWGFVQNRKGLSPGKIVLTAGSAYPYLFWTREDAREFKQRNEKVVKIEETFRVVE